MKFHLEGQHKKDFEREEEQLRRKLVAERLAQDQRQESGLASLGWAEFAQLDEGQLRALAVADLDPVIGRWLTHPDTQPWISQKGYRFWEAFVPQGFHTRMRRIDLPVVHHRDCPGNCNLGRLVLQREPCHDGEWPTDDHTLVVGVPACQAGRHPGLHRSCRLEQILWGQRRVLLSSPGGGRTVRTLDGSCLYLTLVQKILQALLLQGVREPTFGPIRVRRHDYYSSSSLTHDRTTHERWFIDGQLLGKPPLDRILLPGVFCQYCDRPLGVADYSASTNPQGPARARTTDRTVMGEENLTTIPVIICGANPCSREALAFLEEERTWLRKEHYRLKDLSRALTNLRKHLAGDRNALTRLESWCRETNLSGSSSS